MKKMITLFAISWVCLLQAQTPSLKLRLQERETYTMQIEQNSDIVQSAMGQEMKVTSKVQMSSSYKVMGRQDGKWLIEARYLEVNSRTVAPTGDISFGSNAEHKDDISVVIKAMIKAMVNKPYTVLVTDAGEIVSVTGLDEILAEMESDLASLPRARRRTAEDQVKAGFGAEPTKSLMEMCFMKDPERELRAGLVWTTRDTTVVGENKMIADYQCKIDNLDQEAIHTSVTGTIQTDRNSKPIIANGAEVKTQLDGSVRGKNLLNPHTGWCIETEQLYDITGYVTYSMGGNTMDIPLKMTVKATIKKL